MPPRIRTIKPSLFLHEELFDVENETGLPIRLAYVGLFCQCDREGRFKWQPRSLGAQILPFDGVDFSRVLDALATRGFIVRYASNGVDFGHIPSWSKHQVINNRESKSDIPPPVASIDTETTSEDVDASGTREARVKHASHRERKGMEGNGKRTESVHFVKYESAFAELTVDDLRSTASLVAWQQSQASKPDPVVSQSEHDRLRIISAAEQALGGAAVKNPVAVFAGILTKPLALRITNESEGAAEKRIKTLEQSQPSEFATSLGKSLRGEA